MRALLAACRELALDYNTLPKVLYVKFVIIPQILHSSIICELLLYNRQFVIITYELKYVVQAAHR